MKKIYYIFILVATFTSCEDVVEVDVPEGEPKLVIDASLEFERDTSNRLELVEDEIRLSLSTPFFDDTPVPISNATVFITNTTFDFVLNFTESPIEPGVYFGSEGTSSWNFGNDYELTVVYEGETYKAASKITPSVPIDNVVQGDGTLFEGDETEVIISFTDDGSRDDYYLFDFDFSLFLTSEDRFYQGQEFNFSYFYEDMVAGKEVTIKILGIDRRYYNYAGLLIDQSDQDGGNPFLAPPAVLRGNIINTTNPDNYPLGYFNLSEANKFDFVIEEK